MDWLTGEQTLVEFLLCGRVDDRVGVGLVGLREHFVCLSVCLSVGPHNARPRYFILHINFALPPSISFHTLYTHILYTY